MGLPRSGGHQQGRDPHVNGLAKPSSAPGQTAALIKPERPPRSLLLLARSRSRAPGEGSAAPLLHYAAFEAQPRVTELLMGIRLELEPGPEAGHQARDRVRYLLRDRVKNGLLIDLQLIVSELVTNSVRYGPGETIEIGIAVAESGSIKGEVEDHGRGEVTMREITDEGGGFGLRIVDALASRWGVCEGSVWFELGSAA
jgi:Histidine kinase-, DNA gyrase B-, and HSP90-like ATPase